MLFAEDLRQVTWRCVHFAPSQSIVATREDLKGSGIQVFDVDGAPITTEEQLFSALAKEMKFPSYFGRNWDAVDECLRDMTWLPGAGYVLFIRGAEQFWKQSTRLAGALVESWLFAAEDWSQEKMPFHLVFVW